MALLWGLGSEVATLSPRSVRESEDALGRQELLLSTRTLVLSLTYEDPSGDGRWARGLCSKDSGLYV